jgi:ABC-2 type transport system permease protein
MLLLSSTLFILSALSMGILISSMTRSQQVAFFVAALTAILPTFLLSGFVFPIRNMPPAIQAISYVVPARYFVEVLRSILVKGVGVETYWQELVSLSVFTVAVLAVSTIRMSRTKLA